MVSIKQINKMSFTEATTLYLVLLKNKHVLSLNKVFSVSVLLIGLFLFGKYLQEKYSCSIALKEKLNHLR
jgi:hypothetical protein